MLRARTLLPIVAAMACGQAWAQPDSHGRVLAEAKALQIAGDAAERDSISSLLMVALRELLSEPGSHAADLSDIPLSRVETADRAVRILTWNLPQADGSHLYRGLLLDARGKRPVLHELRDRTGSIANPESAECTPDHWYGALYYDLIAQRKGGRSQFTLLGWKGYSRTETRKVVDVLSFRGARPVFGAPVFGNAGRTSARRRVFAFGAQTSMMLRWEAEQQRIVMDHLSPVRPDLERSNAFLGPDMSFDALVWQKGGWVLQRDIDARDPHRSGKPFNPPPRSPRP
jgi:hypothetical protein